MKNQIVNHLNQNQDKYCNKGGKMVVKVDKSKEFVKSGKVLVSEYPAIHPKPTKTTKSE